MTGSILRFGPTFSPFALFDNHLSGWPNTGRRRIGGRVVCGQGMAASVPANAAPSRRNRHSSDVPLSALPGGANHRTPRRLPGDGSPRRSLASGDLAALVQWQPSHRANVEAVDLGSYTLKTASLDPTLLAALGRPKSHPHQIGNHHRTLAQVEDPVAHISTPRFVRCPVPRM